MNCWEAVLYLAYLCDAISKQKCITFYGRHAVSDLKLRDLFGAATQFNPLVGAVPSMGDIIAVEDTANGNIINHVSLCAGVCGEQHYVLHNLGYHAHTTGSQMGGGFHFESFHSLQIRYGQNLNIYFTQPFWVPGSPTCIIQTITHQGVT
jgi:hypothetical protein